MAPRGWRLTMSFIRSSFKGIPALLILFSICFTAAAKGREKEAQDPKPADLVWPAPPDQPRVRFVSAILEEDDFKGKKKNSFLERLMGEKNIEEKVVMRQPYGVAVDNDGRIYVADTVRREILIFDRGNNSINTWTGNRNITLTMPIALALDRDSRLFVSDSKGAQVVMFSPEGKPLASLKGVLKRPVGLAVDNRLGRLYVGDLELYAILVYDLETLKLIKQIGGKKDDSGLLVSAPTNMAVGSDGNLYVSDTRLCRVTILNPEGQFIRSFGTLGDSPGSFARPKGIALDSEGHVYVVDAAFGNIQIFTPEGQLLLAVGRGGDRLGEMLLPAGIAIDKDDRIYVTEQWPGRGRLQIFQYLGDNDPTAVAGGVQ
jgi:DNA-binding beta-propeller fold protein YncE